MAPLDKKIDFAVIIRVANANPNGDPLSGNRPRTDYASFGEITDVCLKRKIRDRLGERDQAKESGQAIFVQSDDRKTDDAKSLRARAEAALGNKLGSAETAKLACAHWLDVRAFGQLFALKRKGKSKGGDGAEGGDDGSQDGISIGIRGPVTIQSAFSVAPIDIMSVQITKSVNAEGDGSKRSSDTMGMKHRVSRGVYVAFGSMNPQLAERTGFGPADADAIKQVLPKLFQNDESSARPAGSMEVLKMIWWQHQSRAGQYSSAKVHRSLVVADDGTYRLEPLDGLRPEEIEGF